MNEEHKEKKEEMFRDIGDEDEKPIELESLCMNCQEDGITRILLVKVPFFKEIIISAFECPHCHYSNNQVQQASEIQRKGMKIKLKITSKSDMDRSLVKMETASFRFENLDFEIPPMTQPGLFTTIEGIISRAIQGLQQNQPLRKYQQPDVFDAIENVIKKLSQILNGELEDTIILDDPSGNSFIQNPFAPQKDPNLLVSYYYRNHEQSKALGLLEDFNDKEDSIIVTNDGIDELQKKLVDDDDEDDLSEVISLPSNCPSCLIPGFLKIHSLDIPHFKQVVIMAFSCDHCGMKTNEVKPGGGISPLGRKCILNIETEEDLNRDLLKSETCTVIIPELELEILSGTLGGRFTTVEGLLTQVKSELEKNSFLAGDSSTNEEKEKYTNFFNLFQNLIDVKESFTLILDDPFANSYIQNIYAPDPDPYLHIQEYKRTFEQNEELGLNQMNTDNYLNDDIEKKD